MRQLVLGMLLTLACCCFAVGAEKDSDGDLLADVDESSPYVANLGDRLSYSPTDFHFIVQFENEADEILSNKINSFLDEKYNRQPELVETIACYAGFPENLSANPFARLKSKLDFTGEIYGQISSLLNCRIEHSRLPLPLGNLEKLPRIKSVKISLTIAFDNVSGHKFVAGGMEVVARFQGVEVRLRQTADRNVEIPARTSDARAKFSGEISGDEAARFRDNLLLGEESSFFMNLAEGKIQGGEIEWLGVMKNSGELCVPVTIKFPSGLTLEWLVAKEISGGRSKSRVVTADRALSLVNEYLESRQKFTKPLFHLEYENLISAFGLENILSGYLWEITVDGTIVSPLSGLDRPVKQSLVLTLKKLPDNYLADEQRAEAFDKYTEKSAWAKLVALSCALNESEATEKTRKKIFSQLEKLNNTATGLQAYVERLTGDCYLKGWGTEINPSTGIKCYEAAAKLGDGEAMLLLALLCESSGSKNEAAKWYAKAAECGSADAIYAPIFQTDKKEGDKMSADEIVKRYRKASLLGSPVAMYNLASLYQRGVFGEADLRTARLWYLQAASFDYPRAMARLGIMCEEGIGGPADLSRAHDWYLRAAEKDSPEAMANLGLLLRRGFGDKPPDEAAGKKWLLRSAELGNVAGMYNLALIYNRSDKEEDWKKAAEWNLKAAEKNDPDAMVNLGAAYEIGKGVEKNPKESFRWYSQAAVLGSVTAQYNLGLMCEKESKWEEARRWYEGAARKDHPDALFRLGYLSLNGKGIKPDVEGALGYFRQAAERGNSDAMVVLGGIYYVGKVVKQDLKETLKWYRHGAEAGNAEAMFFLGMCYEKGMCDLPLDIKESLTWYKKSADKGYSKARQKIDELLK